MRRVLAAIVLLAITPVGSEGQPSLEYDVKAAFVLNFIRYVEWPAVERQRPLELCVLEPNPFGDRLTEVVAGETWVGGAMQVRLVTDMRGAATCHLLYVPAKASTRFAAGLSAIAGRPVLTVGENDRFLDSGGMIHLFVEENRVRFAVNQKAALGVGLQISSRLLRLARTVVGATGP